MIFVDHYEYQGEDEPASHEPYYDCPAGCAYPEVEDKDLTNDELVERYIDPMSLDDIRDIIEEMSGEKNDYADRKQLMEIIENEVGLPDFIEIAKEQ